MGDPNVYPIGQFDAIDVRAGDRRFSIIARANKAGKWVGEYVEYVGSGDEVKGGVTFDHPTEHAARIDAFRLILSTF